MKRKALLVLLAAMTLTVASVGTAFAYEDNGDVATQNETGEHTHTWGEDTWVKTADAVYSESEWVVTKEEQKIEHEAVYGEDKWVVDIPAKWEIHAICYACGYDYTANHDPSKDINDEVIEHISANIDVCGQYGTMNVKVQDEVGHYEKGDLITPAWTETIPEEGYWTEPELITPEQGYWTHECTVCGEIQNRDTGEVIQQGALSGQPTEPVVPNDPNTPQDTPENNVTDDPNTPQTTPDNTPNTETNVTETSTSQNNTTTGNTTGAAAVNTSESKKSPKTGDGTGTMSLLTLVGGALTGGTALAFRKRLAK